MKAVQVTKHGEPEVMKLVELPEPVPAPGQVVVRVAAAGINFADILMRLGFYPGGPKPPYVPGFEVAGTVEAAATDVTGLQPGERVVGATFPNGGYAEKVVMAAERLLKMPSEMSFEEAAALPVNYLTAHQALYYMAHLRAGERVLIHAAAGGVGLAAIQLARLAQAEIFGTASASKHDFLRQQGLQHPIDYHTQDFEEEVRRLTNGEGVDIVLDAVGGRSYRKSYRLLRPGGRLVCFGMSEAVAGKGRSLKAVLAWWNTPSFNPLNLMRKNRAVLGVHLGELGRTNRALLRAWTEEMFRLYAAGQIKPHVGRTFPLAETVAAHHYIHERRNLGKVVLVP